MLQEQPPRVRDLVVAALQSLDGQYEPDELAYLVVTSKFENVVRDRLAWRLHQGFMPQALVAREWDLGGDRVDLAGLRQRQPEVLIELKAMYSFDAWKGVTRTAGPGKALCYDLGRACKEARATTADVYGLLLCTHVGLPVPAELDRIVKYRSLVNLALQEAADPGVVLESSRRLASRFLGSFGEVTMVTDVGVGHAFGLPVHLDAWLVGPVDGHRFGHPRRVKGLGSLGGFFDAAEKADPEALPALHRLIAGLQVLCEASLIDLRCGPSQVLVRIAGTGRSALWVHQDGTLNLAISELRKLGLSDPYLERAVRSIASKSGAPPARYLTATGLRLAPRVVQGSEISRAGVVAVVIDTIRRAASGTAMRTQKVTPRDLSRGEVRIPSTAAKSLLPALAGVVHIDLRGHTLDAPYDLRMGPDREPSGVLRVASTLLKDLVDPGEHLRLSLARGRLHLH